MTDRTTAYARLIVDGKKICGRAEYQACKRHLDDMADRDFPYIFDVKAAEYHIDLANHLTIGEGRTAARLTTRGFQNFIIGSLFGWRRKRSTLRRFREGYIQLARQNGKSFLAGEMCNDYATFAGYQHGRVYTYEVDGKKYLERNGAFYRLEQEIDPDSLKTANLMGVRMHEVEVQEEDAATLEALNTAWYERHKNDEDYLLELQKEAAEKQNEAADLALQEAMRRLNDDAVEKSTVSQEEKIKTYEIEVQIGEAVLDEARARIGADYELGALGDEGGGLAYDCGKLVLDAFTAAGVAFENRYVPDMIEEAKAKGAWHSAGDGYVPQAGDAAVVLGDNHMG